MLPTRRCGLQHSALSCAACAHIDALSASIRTLAGWVVARNGQVDTLEAEKIALSNALILDGQDVNRIIFDAMPED